jgi:TonB-linked SusC/RagA family outer membrane protein
VGAGYATQEQATYFKKLTRYSIFANTDHKLTKWLKIGETIRLVYTDTDRETGGPGLGAEYTVPWQPLYDKTNTQGLAGLSAARLNGTVPSPFDASYVNSLNGFALPGRYVNNYSVANNPMQFYAYGYGAATRTNFLGIEPYFDDVTGMFRTLGGVYAEINPLKGLRIRGTLNIDYYIQKQESFNMIERALFGSSTGKLTNYASEGNSYTYRPRENFNMVKEFLAGYNRTFDKHTIDLIFNASDQKYYWNALSLGIGTNSPISEWDQRRIEEGWNPLYKGSFYERERRGLLGYLGRASYNFDSKYYLDLSVRRDGSSMFAPGYKWGTFPSFAAAWRISREKFMSEIAWLNDLKFRGGWGKVGNQETRPYSYLSVVNMNPKAAFGAGSAVVNGVVRVGDGILYDAAALGDFPVIDLTWETVNTTNIGFDAILLNNQLSLTAEYYYRFTDGILQTYNLTKVVGALSDPKTNLAQVKNSGVEFQVGYNRKFGDVGLNASFNLTTVKNEVVQLAYGKPVTSGDTRIEEGFSMNYIYGYKTAGIYQNAQEVADWKAKTTDPGKDTHKSPGDVNFVDLYGDFVAGVSPENSDKDYKPDGKINDRDRTYLGKTIPGFFYGLNLNLDYKNFDLAMVFQGVGDVQRVNNRILSSASGFGNNFDIGYKDRWTPENTNTDIPRFVQGDPSGNNRTADRMVQSGAFLRFQTMQLGYSFKGGILQKLGVSRLRCYVGGSNLFVISGYDDLDPENTEIPTTFTGGVNLSF